MCNASMYASVFTCVFGMQKIDSVVQCFVVVELWAQYMFFVFVHAHVL